MTAQRLTCHNSTRSHLYVTPFVGGACASSEPVEQPTKFELVVTLNTAKARGVELPQKLLAVADE